MEIRPFILPISSQSANKTSTQAVIKRNKPMDFPITEPKAISKIKQLAQQAPPEQSNPIAKLFVNLTGIGQATDINKIITREQALINSGMPQQEATAWAIKIIKNPFKYPLFSEGKNPPKDWQELKSEQKKTLFDICF